MENDRSRDRDRDRDILSSSFSSGGGDVTPSGDVSNQSSRERRREISDIDLVNEIEMITSYRFKNARLLEQALTNFSSGEENCNIAFDRLEFYGDAILNYFVTRILYKQYKDLSSGQLTLLRAANVDTEKLVRVAIKHDFHRFFHHEKPLLALQVEEFKKGILEYPLHSFGLIDAPKPLSNIVESFTGALHFDCGDSSDIMEKVLKKLLEPMITPETLKMHPVTKLHELCQKNGWKIRFRKENWKEKGEIEVYIENELVGKAEYMKKKSTAINRAADDAYNQISINHFTFMKNDDVPSHDNDHDHDNNPVLTKGVFEVERKNVITAHASYDDDGDDGDNNQTSTSEGFTAEERRNLVDIDAYHDDDNDDDDDDDDD